MNNIEELPPKKQKALNFFLKQLLNSSAGKEVEKIFLFGSLAWGKPDKESDIDILVFSRKRRPVERVIDELTLDASLKYGESIEPLIYPSIKAKTYQSPLVLKVIKYGKELYTRNG